jgi:PPK2 family polyphosphate:nucleotide phosphotransferase
MGKLDLDRFCVPDERTVRLKDYDPQEDAGLDKPDGERLLEENLARFDDLQQRFWANKSKSLLVVLQGIDTAGKDGVIRKVFTAFNPQGVFVQSFKQPSSLEASHDYLWRIHLRCPARGDITVFNRSHYEDVLVTRVHKLVSPRECERRYRQIRDFERMLSEEGTVVLKFFLLISKEEQLERLRARLDDPAKQWKFSSADVKERGSWDSYMEAFEEMLSSTGAEHAPWYIVPSNRKWFRNLLASEVVLRTLRDLRQDWPKPTVDLTRVTLE